MVTELSRAGEWEWGHGQGLRAASRGAEWDGTDGRRGAGMLHRAPSCIPAPRQVVRSAGAKPNENPASFCIIRRY